MKTVKQPSKKVKARELNEGWYYLHCKYPREIVYALCEHTKEFTENGFTYLFTDKAGKQILDTWITTKSSSQRKKELSLLRWGVEDPMQSKEVQDKIKATVRKNWGVDSIGSSKTIQEKIRKTNLERYGVSTNLQIPSVRKTVQKNNVEKYGTPCYFKSSVHREFMRKKFKNQEYQEQLRKNHHENVQRFEEQNDCLLQGKVIQKYGLGWLKSIKVNSIQQGKHKFIKKSSLKFIEEHTHQQKKISFFEYAVLNFMKEIMGQEQVLSGVKNILPNREMDIYIPSKNVAIECNGIYWHSTYKVHKNAHLERLKRCQEKGVRLVHISEWEWKHKQDICKSILSGVCGIFQQRIFARQCIFKEVSSKEASVFLNENHIQGGNINSKWRYGLYYKGELVQLITLGPSRFKKGETELLRMCTKLNTQVIGGFSKLMSNLPSELSEVYSYIDRSKFSGKGYYTTGWEFVAETEPNYHYYKGNARYTRNQCQKHKLKAFLGEDNFNEQLSETENMLRNGYLKMYDSGNIKVKWKRG